MWATESISRSFCFRKGIPTITSCDINGATLRSVGDLTFTSTGDRNCLFMRRSSLTHTDLFVNLLYSRAEETEGRGQRIVEFPLTSFWDMKSEVEPQSISLFVVIWSSSWIERIMGGTTWYWLGSLN